MPELIRKMTKFECKIPKNEFLLAEKVRVHVYMSQVFTLLFFYFMTHHLLKNKMVNAGQVIRVV